MESLLVLLTFQLRTFSREITIQIHNFHRRLLHRLHLMGPLIATSKVNLGVLLKRVETR